MDSTSAQASPKLIEALSGKGLKQVTAGVRHCAACNTTLPVRGITNIAVPLTVPSQYSALREIPCQAIHARLLLLNHFARMITMSWRLFSIHSRPRVSILFVLHTSISLSLSLSLSLIHTLTHAYTYTDMNTHRADMHMQTKHKYTHVHTYIHAHTHTHTHTDITCTITCNSLPVLLFFRVNLPGSTSIPLQMAQPALYSHLWPLKV